MQPNLTELAQNRLNPETLQSAIQQVQLNGYVIFEGILPSDLVGELHTAFIQIFEAHVARTDPNRGANRYQMHLPFCPPFNDPHVITHPFILPILEALLGPDGICHYFAADTPMAGSDYQAVHWDIQPLFPENDQIVLPPYSLVLNIPLVEVHEENGPLEIWPGGTHLLHGRPNIQEVAPIMHSERVLMPAGSLLLRDSRMWHRGTPSRSPVPRPHLALIYSRHWLKLRYPPIDIPQETYAGLSERAKHLFRLENIGESLDS
jgi:hypothetical protein